MIPRTLLIFFIIIISGYAKTFTLEKALKLSIENDAWLDQSKYMQRSIELKSISAGSYPDPKVNIGMLNLPTDTFDRNQEAMTQLILNVSQQFPRGDTLQIRREQLQLKAAMFPFQRENRKLKTVVQMTNLWLEVYKIQETIAIIEKNKELFEQLLDISELHYSRALGKTRQYDIIHAELELTNLDDRITFLEQKKEQMLSVLSEWLYQWSSDKSSIENYIEIYQATLPKKLVHIQLINQKLFEDNDLNELLQSFEEHPSIQNINFEIAAEKKETLLAKEAYKPQFGVYASYANRDDDLMGRSRADLFSTGITFDLPIFTKNRQDKEMESSVQKVMSIQSKKRLALRKFLSSFETVKSQIKRLQEREKLYKDKLIPQTKEQSESALNAYTNDDGDFSEVLRSKIALLNKSIDALHIRVDIEKSIVQYNYLFSKNAEELLKTIITQGEKQ